MKVKILAAVLLCTCSAAAAPAKSNFTLSAPYGPNAVGFRVVQQYDLSRSFHRVNEDGIPTEGARPIQTLIWYPAQQPKDAKPVLYGRYLELMATEDDFSVNAQDVAPKLRRILETHGIARNYDRERVQVTRSFADAPPLSGPYPVVIYASSINGSAMENADLCEYLASHGYIVLASASIGSQTRNMSFDLKSIEAQVGDIGFLVGYLHDIPQANRTRIAVVGWSWGGMNNIFAAAQDSRINALVCLDGSSRYQSARMKEGVTTGLVNPSKLTVPLIYFASRPSTLEQQQRQFEGTEPFYDFLDLLKKNDSFFVQTSEMVHSGFSSRSIRFREDKDFTDDTPAEFSRDYSLVAQYTFEFLEAYLKNDPAARLFLKNDPEKNGVPRHLFDIDFRAAPQPAENISEFARRLVVPGFDKAPEIYQEVKRDDPNFKLSEGDVNRWGYLLLDAGKLDKAIDILRLNVAMYPESSNAYDSLGEAQEAVSDNQGAIGNYQKSLALNPQNFHARERLKKLESGTQP